MFVFDISTRERLSEACRLHHVRRLQLFGSVARGDDDESSDLNFLVEFLPLEPEARVAAYLGLLETLQATLGRPVDLVEADAEGHPVFRDLIDPDRIDLYRS